MTTGTKIRWKRRYPGGYDSVCGHFRVWHAGDEAWYGEAYGAVSEPLSHKVVAQNWCQRHRDERVEEVAIRNRISDIRSGRQPGTFEEHKALLYKLEAMAPGRATRGGRGDGPR